MATAPKRGKTMPLGTAAFLAGLVFVGLTLSQLLAGLVLIGLAALPSSQVSFPHADLVIERSDGQNFSFDVELATTPEQKTRGLMFREAMPRDSGMLFLYEPGQPVAFWMMNTSIPLDMLFVRGDGAIIKIASHTVPFSLAPINADEPVRAVIEINAGEADRRDIHTGDKVVYPAFDGR